MKPSKIISLSAVTTALAVIFLAVGAYVDVMDLSCLFMSSLMIMLPLSKKSVKSALFSYGATAILTDPNLPSGTDRIAAALKVLDPDGSKYDIVVDFQGDNINVDPKVTIPLVEMIERTGCDIATCGMLIKSEEDKNNPNVVKIIMGLKEGEKEGRCLYFTRATAPYTRNPEKCPNQDLYYHIGIYVFKASSLQKMVSLPTGVLEQREALEQLRALENGMEVRAMLVDNIKLVDEAPADINTEEDLANALPYIK